MSENRLECIKAKFCLAHKVVIYLKRLTINFDLATLDELINNKD